MKISEQIGEFPHYEILRALIEAAIRDQKVTESSSEALRSAVVEFKKHTAELPDNLVAAVTETLLAEIKAELEGVIAAAQSARRTFDQTASLSLRKLMILPACCFIAGLLGILLYVRVSMPDPRHLQALREEEARLQANLTELERKGASAYIVGCRARGLTWPCIRTDEGFGRFGPEKGATYRVIFGAKPEK